ncbi:hypothetical protein A2634_00900 [Candidatus Amesbacteria bacterium RIFCSPHIGHO2_01_FULL_48_32]|uniref:Uncharacterized protein n=1 Tax=Candidatus Amesbacteria bacterium RIFCSPLOWO2_01_FULL_48_25 TaxID=1797259 RepID=A0A1F4ZD58_9BACT|nr:MAG: hypothetical protein A2634_00900 [Candidatus Amesbacteria bacterium RIFCSPHIGHO2_01_FULL_48_32]OGD03364.1 MAG: hypothetical protein A2989_00850 [Candidatus Amesbacteria bacterium RIFCSPLOWO2_01_FULL_48_25]HJZ05317.1 hypothetical protein [Patescibacteria group bacterium]
MPDNVDIDQEFTKAGAKPMHRVSKWYEYLDQVPLIPLSLVISEITIFALGINRQQLLPWHLTSAAIFCLSEIADTYSTAKAIEAVNTAEKITGQVILIREANRYHSARPSMREMTSGKNALFMANKMAASIIVPHFGILAGIFKGILAVNNLWIAKEYGKHKNKSI